jgi:hypothetical protein
LIILHLQTAVAQHLYTFPPVSFSGPLHVPTEPHSVYSKI